MSTFLRAAAVPMIAATPLQAGVYKAVETGSGSTAMATLAALTVTATGLLAMHATRPVGNTAIDARGYRRAFVASALGLLVVMNVRELLLADGSQRRLPYLILTLLASTSSVVAMWISHRVRRSPVSGCEKVLLKVLLLLTTLMMLMAKPATLRREPERKPEPTLTPGATGAPTNVFNAGACG